MTNGTSACLNVLPKKRIKGLHLTLAFKVKNCRSVKANIFVDWKPRDVIMPTSPPLVAPIRCHKCRQRWHHDNSWGGKTHLIFTMRHAGHRPSGNPITCQPKEYQILVHVGRTWKTKFSWCGYVTWVLFWEPIYWYCSPCTDIANHM